jgi:citrate/tricarballylate utilization protein
MSTDPVTPADTIGSPAGAAGTPADAIGTPADAIGPLVNIVGEARHQVEICNACRYCEGFCSVFPAITRKRHFTDGDLTQLANLCHNCRGCHYACQYTEPHEFALNLPRVLAEVRVESWERFAWPGRFARLFQRSGVALGAALAFGLAAILLALLGLRPAGGEGFYAILSHGAMVAIFLPAFLLPFVAMAIGLRRYWRAVGGERVRWSHLRTAAGEAAQLKDLSGGQGQGCNYEKGDRYTNARRHAHQDRTLLGPAGAGGGQQHQRAQAEVRGQSPGPRVVS